MAFLCTNFVAQECHFVLKGLVKESFTDKPLPDAYVYIVELSVGMSTNENGFFEFSNLCNRYYHLEITHIGCETKRIHLHLKASKTLEISMEHYVQMLDGVYLLGHKRENTTVSVQQINAQKIQENANQNLGNLLEELVGVNTLTMGSGVSKPVVHGMYGNRVMILNNGIVQSGQQWGVDHSPEIDPMIANRLRVIKGVGVLEYQGSSLGSLIAVEPKKISDDGHLHGAVNSFFETNGNGVGTNLTMEKSSKLFDWRVIGTLKKYGDRTTPNYYLTNTGLGEANLALQLKKQWKSNMFTKMYISSFNTEIGILRGTHLSTKSDLEGALTQSVPFNTEDAFSYDIKSPRQKVHHHLLKLTHQYNVSEKEWYRLMYSGQLNLRREFDVRRQGRSNIPALKINQATHQLEAKHEHQVGLWQLKQGIQYTFTNNTNSNEETGVLPLIPDYLSHQIGGFGLATYKSKKWMYELGARYNFTFQNVATIQKESKISNTTGNEYLESVIVRYNNYFHKVGLVFGTMYKTSKKLHIAFNTGLTSRNPGINELYSDGLHQGVATVEKGDRDLKQEIGLKTTLSFEGNIHQKLFFESLIHHQYVHDYIFLKPLVGDENEEIDVTTRGAFRIRAYNQANVKIFGLDMATTYQFTSQMKLGAKYSFLRGNNLSENQPLIDMPANNLLTNFEYNFSKGGKFSNSYVRLNYKYVWEQTHYEQGQDFIFPPEAYQLFGLQLGTEIKWQKSKINVYAKATNIFDVSYRDYLNRLRYFSDENGRSVVLGIRVKF